MSYFDNPKEMSREIIDSIIDSYGGVKYKKEIVKRQAIISAYTAQRAVNYNGLDWRTVNGVISNIKYSFWDEVIQIIKATKQF